MAIHQNTCWLRLFDVTEDGVCFRQIHESSFFDIPTMDTVFVSRELLGEITLTENGLYTCLGLTALGYPHHGLRFLTEPVPEPKFRHLWQTKHRNFVEKPQQWAVSFEYTAYVQGRLPLGQVLNYFKKRTDMKPEKAMEGLLLESWMCTKAFI